MRVSITGVDGTGKTSIIRTLQHASGPAGPIRAFRAPQYHEDPDAPFGQLSAEIDALSEHADRLSDPLLKTCALFLSMTLYGDVEAHYERTFRPRILFSERQALADSLAYSKFYKGLLTGPIKPQAVPGLKLFDSWIKVLKKRMPDRSPIDVSGLDFWNLPLFIRDLFNLPPSQLVQHLQALYQCKVPDRIILLKVSPARLAERLGLKAKSGQQKEMHEKQHVLEALQVGLEQCCQSLEIMAPSLKLHVLDTSELDLEQSASRCLELVSSASMGTGNLLNPRAYS